MSRIRNPWDKLLFTGAALLAACLGSFDANAQLRVATYNTLDGPNNAAEDAMVQTIFGAIGTTSTNGIARPVDIIGLQEQASLSGPDTADRTAAALNSLYGVNTYQAEIIDTGFDSIAYVYNSATVNIVSSQLVGVGLRPGHRVAWRPVGYTSTESLLYTYNVHLKAGSFGSDASQRAAETANLRNNADALGPDANIIYMGDFNLQGPGETAYQNLIATGNGQAVDPLGLTFWNGIGNAIHHTQSTRTSSLADGGSPGGMDDRFDLQLVSSELVDGNGLSYIGPTSAGSASLDHSYQAFGNDGNTFDAAINSVLTNRSQSTAVINALHDFTDHLPVVADYQLPAIADFSVDQSTIRTIAGEAVAVFVTVDNVAPVSMDIAADTLDYTLIGSGDAYVALGPYSDSLAVNDVANEHLIIGRADTPGVATLDISLQSNDQGAINAEQNKQVDIVGLDHAQATFALNSISEALTIDFGQVNVGEGAGSLSQNFIVLNQEITRFFTADLIVSDAAPVSGDTDVLSVAGLASTVEAGSFTLGEAFFDTTQAGSYSAVFNIAVSDEDIIGAASGNLTLTLLGEVISQLLLGDADGDGDVDAFDITAVEQNFGNTGLADGSLLGDADEDGDVDAFDITAVEQNFGNTLAVPVASAMALRVVPEPGSLALLLFAGFPLAQRRSHKKRRL